jgi:hypothetical protein
MFDRLIHADWSKHNRKRWAATARRVGGIWEVGAPERAGIFVEILQRAFDAAERDRVLLGFDFPIGLPEAYGDETGVRGFVDFWSFSGLTPVRNSLR